MYADWQAVKNKGVIKSPEESTGFQEKKMDYQCYDLIQEKILLRKRKFLINIMKYFPNNQIPQGSKIK